MSEPTLHPISSSQPLAGVDRVRLESVLAPAVHAHGAEVVDVEFKSEPAGWVLRIFVEKVGLVGPGATPGQTGADLDLCTAVARDLSPALDVADLIPQRYTLEVSSPGLERLLRGEADFVRFAGKKAKLKLARPAAGQHVLVGVLGPVDRGIVTLTDGRREHAVPLADITAAHLVFDFGPAHLPRGPRSRGHGPGRAGRKK